MIVSEENQRTAAQHRTTREQQVVPGKVRVGLTQLVLPTMSRRYHTMRKIIMHAAISRMNNAVRDKLNLDLNLATGDKVQS